MIVAGTNGTQTSGSGTTGDVTGSLQVAKILTITAFNHPDTNNRVTMIMNKRELLLSLAKLLYGATTLGAFVSLVMCMVWTRAGSVDGPKVGGVCCRKYIYGDLKCQGMTSKPGHCENASLSLRVNESLAVTRLCYIRWTARNAFTSTANVSRAVRHRLICS